MATSNDTLTPIGVFWDIENCCVPKWRSALLVVQRIREKFFNGHREVEFMCVCDTSKESKLVIQELNSAQVNVVHVDAVGKNAADDKLRQNIRRFADTHSPPATILLISSDVNFASDLSDLRHRRKFDIILIHKQQTHEALIVCAREHHLYEELVKDVPARTPSKCPEGQTELKVTGYPPYVEQKSLKMKLQQLSNNCGGRVVSITMDYVLIKFTSSTAANKARRRMDGEEVFGSKIHVDFSVKPTSVQLEASKSPKQQNSKSERNSNSPKGYRKEPSPQRSLPVEKIKKSSPDCIPPRDFRFSTQNPDWQTTNSVLDGVLHDQVVNQASPPSSTYFTAPGQLEGKTDHPQTQSSEDKDQLKGVVKKFSEERKSSRQLLMLQQQMYQEEQTPIFNPNHSTQFYSQYTARYHESYSNHGYSSHQWQHNSCHNNQYCQSWNKNNYNRNYSSLMGTYPYSNDGGNTDKMFCPIRSPSPNSLAASTPPSDLDLQAELEFPDSVELIVSNLDYNISAREWKHILLTTFQPHVKILYISVQLQPDNTSLGSVRVASIEEARFAISQFHRKKIGYKRIHVTLRNEDSPRTLINARAEAVALLQEAKGNVLPVFKFIEMFEKRYRRTISVSELYKMRDVIEIQERGGAGRMVYLVPSPETTPSPQDVSDVEVQDILEQALCCIHCPEGSTMYAEVMNCSILPNVQLQLKTFAPQVHSLLMSHDGDMPLMSFPACYSVEIAPVSWVLDGGVPLEHLISCVPGIQIIVSKTGVKKVSWAENKPPASLEFGRQCSSPLLNQQLSQISREMIDLLKHSPNCRMPFSKFIPSYHHHFGRQCRVADYGYSKLMELFEAIPHVLQVLGTGDRRVLTLTHRAQVRRFTADITRLLKTLPGKQLQLSGLCEAFYKLTNKEWDISEYGVCCVEDMLNEIPASSLSVSVEGLETMISIPRRADQTLDEMERTKLFSLEVVDLLKHNHQCRMLFNKFIPAYHHHFGRQCRVSDYGFTKLLDLFEAIPHVVELVDEGEEKIINLTEPELRKVVGEQIVNLLKSKKTQCLPLDSLMMSFSLHYGFPIPLQDFSVYTVEELMNKLKHVLKVEQYDNKDYIVLADRTSAPPLALQVLQLLMDQSGGSLPLMELCSRYKTTFGVEPDIKKIKEELLDYVQVSGDDESGVISLTPLQILARDVRLLLQRHGKVSLSEFEQLCKDQFGTEIKPALYGFPTIVALLMAIPHVVSIKGKGYRRVVHLSGDLQGTLPIIDECYTRPDSDTPSNDSGSALTDDDQPTGGADSHKLPQSDLLGGRVPSNIPSPDLAPEMMALQRDLITLEFSAPGGGDQIWNINEEERKKLKTPLCKTPTSELLQLAAQCLPPPSPTTGKPRTLESPSGSCSTAEELVNMLKTGWWSASASQLEEVSKTIKTNALQDMMNKLTSSQSKHLKYVDSQSQTSEDITDPTTSQTQHSAADPNTDTYTQERVNKTSSQQQVVTEGQQTPIKKQSLLAESCLEKLDKEKISSVLVKLQGTVDTHAEGEDSHHDCVATDTVCYEALFRQDHPLETSSIKSDTSCGESPQISPSKLSRLETKTEDGSPGRPSPRRSRIAAKFGQPIGIQ